MISARALASFAVVLAFAATLASCKGSADRCTANADCDVTHDGSRGCDVDSGACHCLNDHGCSAGEQCNAAGRCQTTGGCADNGDCGAGLFCDVVTEQCIAQQVCGSGNTCCTLDDQCPFTEICDVVSSSCISGCRDDGDCLLGQGCDGGGLGRLGQCGVACTNDALCAFGQLCDTTTGTCRNDTRGPYCFGCSGGVASNDCGDHPNKCLLDTVNGGAYCGVDCSQGQACPFGYECRDVIILPRSTLPICPLPEACVNSACARTGAVCSVDEDCPEGPPGSNCPRADIGNFQLDVTIPCANDDQCAGHGACLKQECRQREGATFGICSCTKDTDCPRDRCVEANTTDAQHPVAGHCELSGHACFEDFECDLITCIDGGCLLGRNCKPANDRTCADLLPGTTPATTPGG